MLDSLRAPLFQAGILAVAGRHAGRRSAAAGFSDSFRAGRHADSESSANHGISADDRQPSFLFVSLLFSDLPCLDDRGIVRFQPAFFQKIFGAAVRNPDIWDI